MILMMGTAHPKLLGWLHWEE